MKYDFNDGSVRFTQLSPDKEWILHGAKDTHPLGRLVRTEGDHEAIYNWNFTWNPYMSVEAPEMVREGILPGKYKGPLNFASHLRTLEARQEVENHQRALREHAELARSFEEARQDPSFIKLVATAAKLALSNLALRLLNNEK